MSSLKQNPQGISVVTTNKIKDKIWSRYKWLKKYYLLDYIHFIRIHCLTKLPISNSKFNSISHNHDLKISNNGCHEGKREFVIELNLYHLHKILKSQLLLWQWLRLWLNTNIAKNVHIPVYHIPTKDYTFLYTLLYFTIYTIVLYLYRDHP